MLRTVPPAAADRRAASAAALDASTFALNVLSAAAPSGFFGPSGSRPPPALSGASLKVAKHWTGGASGVAYATQAPPAAGRVPVSDAGAALAAAAGTASMPSAVAEIAAARFRLSSFMCRSSLVAPRIRTGVDTRFGRVVSTASVPPQHAGRVGADDRLHADAMMTGGCDP